MKRIFVMLLSLTIIFNSAVEVNARKLPRNQTEMADKIAQIAIDNYDEYGVLPSVCVAQAFIESTLGEHVSNTHNYFGIRSGAVGYSSFEDGVIGYLKVINNGLYDGALFNKSYESSIKYILNGGYCQPAGDYYSNATWSIQTYNFDNYDKKLWKKKAEEKRKDKWKKKYTFVYDPNVPDNKVMVDEEIIKGGTITSYVNDISLIVDIIPGSKGREIRTNISELDGCKAYINVYENAVG